MHCTSNFRKGAFFTIISVLLFAACKPDSDKTTLATGDDGGGYASDLSRVELYNNDVISLADNAGLIYNAAYMRTSQGTCATVGVDTFSTPHVLTIRFGDKNNTCLDGRTRRGTIIVKYMGNYSDTAQVHTITYDNYYINGNQLRGSVKTVKVDTTITGDWYYKVQVNDSLNMSPDPLKSQYIVWSGNLVRKWTQGKTTGERGDDVFSISGNAVLTRPNGHVFGCDIAVPLQFALNCDYAESGVVNVTGYEGVRVLNYGAGSCDNTAQLNINVHIYQLTLTK